MRWSKIEEQSGDIPGKCRAHAAAMVDHQMYIFGGGNGVSPLNETYVILPSAVKHITNSQSQSQIRVVCTSGGEHKWKRSDMEKIGAYRWVGT